MCLAWVCDISSCICIWLEGRCGFSNKPCALHIWIGFLACVRWVVYAATRTIERETEHARLLIPLIIYIHAETCNPASFLCMAQPINFMANKGNRNGFKTWCCNHIMMPTKTTDERRRHCSWWASRECAIEIIFLIIDHSLGYYRMNEMFFFHRSTNSAEIQLHTIT